jgi:hypothetical protein
MKLGDLSAEFESNGDPGTVSGDPNDPGGQSYGCYQFASAYNIPQDFVAWVVANGIQPFCQVLPLYEVGSENFNANWRQLAADYPDQFADVQWQYTKVKYFDTAVADLQAIGFDVLSRSEALQQVLWSRSVQFSDGNMVDLFTEAARYAGQELGAISDHDLIYWIYEVEYIDGAWTSGYKALRERGTRFDREREKALAMLGQ